MFTDTKKLTEECARLMREAGKLILGAHGSGSAEMSHIKPGTANFVTDCDIAVQKYLIEGLQTAFPDAFFIAEEKENTPEALNGELCFIIDPIDGTNCFMHNCRASAISVGAVSRGVSVFGAVYNPYSDEYYHAAKGQGAYVNGSPIRVSERPLSMGIIQFGTCPYCKDTLSEKVFAMAREIFCACVDLHRSGSAAIDLCNIANGSREGSFEMILQPWDIAAGKLILEEAGGILSDMTGAAVDLSGPASVLAANRAAYGDLLKITKKYF